MGWCEDKSLSHLKHRGYNVVRHPSAAIQPLDLIGLQQGEPRHLGPLNMLITNPPGSLPSITRDVPAADINGQSSSTLKIGVGATILGNLIGAMGGTLGVNLSYTNAKQITFTYAGVLNDSVVPLEVGNYLRNAEVDSGNLILQQYVLGHGKLFVITKIAKSKKFTVKYEVGNGVDANVQIPDLQKAVSANSDVHVTASAASTVSFDGNQNLIFAFQCFAVGVIDGVLKLTAQPAGGGVFLAVDESSATKVESYLLHDTGMLPLMF